jgi:hypothetical protein
MGLLGTRKHVLECNDQEKITRRKKEVVQREQRVGTRARVRGATEKVSCYASCRIEVRTRIA